MNLEIAKLMKVTDKMAHQTALSSERWAFRVVGAAALGVLTFKREFETQTAARRPDVEDESRGK